MVGLRGLGEERGVVHGGREEQGGTEKAQR
jgi:hypothetical protein